MPGGVAWYRVNSPWAAVSKIFREEVQVDFLKLDASNPPKWPDLIEYDLFFVHSPTHEKILKVLEECVFYGVKIWVDFDDLIFDIPTSNAAGRFFNKGTSQIAASAIAMAVANGGIVSVSTEALRENIIPRFNGILPTDIHVIPNAADDVFHGFRPHRHPYSDPPVVLWRGSGTHDGDLASVRDAFRDFPIKKKDNKMTGIRYCFFGHLPWVFEKRYGGHLEIKNIKDLQGPSIANETALYFPWQGDMKTFRTQMRGFSADYVVVPLVDDAFNRSKSNIAWLEATEAGAVTIAPASLPEFASQPVITYKSEADLAKIFRQIAGGKDLRGDLLEESIAVIEDKFRLSDVSRKRMEVLRAVV